MFAPVLQSQAKKRIPMIENVKEKIEKFLLNLSTCESLEEDLEIVQKALECRKSDIEKAENTPDEYFIKLLGDAQESKKDLEPIENALTKIKEYSD